MPDAAHLTAFAVAAATIALLPGPGILYVLARALGGGRRTGLRSAMGTGIGGLVHVGAAAAGLSAVIAASAAAFGVVRYLGAAYLVWLGVRTLLERNEQPPLDPMDTGAAASAGALRQGVVTEVLNPKTALFFVTFLPQFCQPGRGPLAVQLLALGAASVVLNTSVDVAVAFGAGRLSDRLRARPRAWARQRLVTGGVLVGLGVYTAAAGHRSR